MHRDAIFYLFGEVTLYGIFIAVGLLCCLGVFFFLTKRNQLSIKVQDFSFFVAIAAIALGFLGAKLFQTFFNFLDNGVWDFNRAGITVMGGLLFGGIAFILVYYLFGNLYFKNKNQLLHKAEFNKIVIVAPLCITIAHAFGRIGCLMAGCCHGAFLSHQPVLGGLYMVTPDKGSGYFVPIQLYEAIFLFVLFAILTILYFKRCNILLHIYVISYGVWRFIIEFFRTDERGFTFLGLAPSQWMSFVFVGIGVALIIIYIVKKIPFVLPKGSNGENFGKTK